MEKTKIAIIFPKDSEALFDRDSKRTFGGASVQMYNVAKELGGYTNIKTYSFIPNYSNINFHDQKFFNLVKVYNEGENIIRGFLNLTQKLKSFNPDVVIQHGLALPSGFLAKYCKLRKIKFVYMFASDIEVEGRYQSSRKKNFLFKLLLNNSYKLIVQNKFQKDFLKKHYGKDSLILRNGFEFKEEYFTEKEHVLWVGRCEKLKKPELFLEIAKENVDEKFFLIAPKTSDIEYFQKIKEEAKKIENLQFFPFVDFTQINEYFKNAKILLNTSDYEGFPQTFIQATMNSTPIVSLNSNPDDFLTNYNCGFFVNGDIDLMKEKVKILLKNEKIFKEMSKNAFKYSEENHDIKKNVKKLLEIIV